MFDQIGVAAEKLAANVSESRRGFLVRVGQAAGGIAAALGGLLAFPTGARAVTHGYCQALPLPGEIVRLTGWCVGSNCQLRYMPKWCKGYGSAPGPLCRRQVAFTRWCAW
jgi:hypothetical protein